MNKLKQALALTAVLTAASNVAQAQDIANEVSEAPMPTPVKCLHEGSGWVDFPSLNVAKKTFELLTRNKIDDLPERIVGKTHHLPRTKVTCFTASQSPEDITTIFKGVITGAPDGCEPHRRQYDCPTKVVIQDLTSEI